MGMGQEEKASESSPDEYGHDKNPEAAQEKRLRDEAGQLKIFLKAVSKEKGTLCGGLVLALTVCLLGLTIPLFSEWKHDRNGNLNTHKSARWEDVGHEKEMPIGERANFYIFQDITSTSPGERRLQGEITRIIKQFHRDGFDGIWCAYFGGSIFPETNSIALSLSSESCSEVDPDNQIPKEKLRQIKRRTDIKNVIKALQDTIESEDKSGEQIKPAVPYTDFVFIITDGAHDLTGHNQTCPTSGVDLIGASIESSIQSFVESTAKHSRFFYVMLLLTSHRGCSDSMKRLWDTEVGKLGIQTAAVKSLKQADMKVSTFIRESYEGYFFKVTPANTGHAQRLKLRDNVIAGKNFSVRYRIETNHLLGTIGPRILRIPTANLVSDDLEPILLEASGTSRKQTPNGVEREPLIFSIPRDGAEEIFKDFSFTFADSYDALISKDRDYQLELQLQIPTPRTITSHLSLNRPFLERSEAVLMPGYNLPAAGTMLLGIVGLILSKIVTSTGKPRKFLKATQSFPKNYLCLNCSFHFAMSLVQILAVSSTKLALTVLLLSPLGPVLIGLRAVSPNQRFQVSLYIIAIASFILNIITVFASATSVSP